jgi:hypothetical protein
MVIPLHIGLTTIVDPTNSEPIDGDFITLGVVEGTPAPFGSKAPSDATYGGLVVSRVGVGVMSFKYSTGSTDCSASKVMPILEPFIGDANLRGLTETTVPETTVPATTAAPATTVPATTAAPATTVPATTAAPATTVPATTAAPATTVPTTKVVE